MSRPSKRTSRARPGRARPSRTRRLMRRVLGLDRQPRSWRRLAVRWTLLAAVSLTSLFAGFVGLVYALADIPEPSEIAVAQSARVVDAEGRTIGRISAAADRVSISLGQMPEHLRHAVVAVEDRTFYTHAGVSVPSIARAAFKNLVGGGIQQGGSTITQQYVKNAFVGNERTVMRKVKEAVLALKLERQRSKDEIIELYLNTIYMGRGAYGAQAATQAYFGRNARSLTLPESALLAGMIHAPEAYDPAGDPDGVRARRDTVLRLMREQGMITAAEQREAAAAPVRVRARRIGGMAPHFLESVREQLERDLGARVLYSGGVRVQVTLDRDMQRAAEEAVRSVYDRPSDPDAALVAIDPATGAVRALVGARDFARRQLNLAMRGARQPGSTFKTMVLAAAIDEGIPTTRVYPAPARRVFEIPPRPWTVWNYDRAGHGRLTVARATELSVNTVYAKLAIDVGAEDVASVAARLGIRTELPAVPSLALGTAEVTPLELTSAYATLAARGVYREPFLVERVTGGEGEVLYQREAPEDQRALEEGAADRVNTVLEGVVRRGTGRAAAIGRPAAGKTGTTEEFNDAWFAGYTPDLATVVWNGYAEGGRQLRGVRGRNVTGGSFPAQMWRAFMREALEGIPPTPFGAPPPEGDGSPDGSPGSTTAPTASTTGHASPVSPPPGTTPPATPSPDTSTGEPEPTPTGTTTPTSSPTATPTATATATPTDDP